ncbi:MAG: hypothetical protein ACETWQ_15295 [Phycisphaerae bacterium]
MISSGLLRCLSEQVRFGNRDILSLEVWGELPHASGIRWVEGVFPFDFAQG